MPYTWTPRTTAPTPGTPPYDWNAGTKYQCTWYAYWRVQEGFNASFPPVWKDGYGSNGSGRYTNAKDWLIHYRDPWIPHDLGDGYVPVAGDIVVFTGTYGHCVVIESKNGDGSYVVTDFNLIGGDETWGRKTNYNYGDRITDGLGPLPTGACIGCLHFPDSTPDPPTPTPLDPITISITAEIILKKGGNFNVKL